MDASEIERLFDVVASFYEQGDLQAAERCCYNLCDACPTYAPAVGLMGVILCQTGRAEIGVQFIEKATDLAPDEATFFNNLGTGYIGLNRLDEALAAFTRALELAPENAQTHNNIGAVLRPLGRLQDAARHYAKACELAPAAGQIFANHANVLMDLDRVDAAETAARRAVELTPGNATAHNNLGTVMQRRGQYAAAADCFRRALGLNAGYADAHANMAEVLKDTGRAADALAHYQRARELDPAAAGMASNHLLALCGLDTLSATEIARAHRKWGDEVSDAASTGVSAAISTKAARAAGGKAGRLRIGYVSADFRRHSVAYFIEPVLKHHDRDGVEVFAYANMPTPGDAVTERLKAAADHWRDVFGLDDAAFAEAVRADGIDVLVDLAGHTRGNRLAAFARRAAPVQISYLGYPATTGLTAMDFRLTDTWADPPGQTETLHRETLLPIEGGFLCYQPDDAAPPVTPLPAAANGDGVTFGSFNNLAKLTPTVIKTWAAVLNGVAGSRLVLKAKALGDAATAARVTDAFAAHGIDPTRMTCLGWITDGAPLGAYHDIDIALDTFPYNGTTTTCEALWMGVPVVTLAGNWHAARVGISLMTKLGLEDWIAPDREAYVALAARKAADRTDLATIRASLRNRVAERGLTDGRAFCKALEAAYGWAVKAKPE